MKITEMDGKKLWQWSDNEDNARRSFEEAVLYIKAIDKLMNALIVAVANKERESKEAWSAVKQLIKQCDSEAKESDTLSYDWVLGAFKATK